MTEDGGLVLHLPQQGLGMGTDALALMQDFMGELEQRLDGVRRTFRRRESFDAFDAMARIFAEMEDIDTIAFLTSSSWDDDGNRALSEIEVQWVQTKGSNPPEGLLKESLQMGADDLAERFEIALALVGVLMDSGTSKGRDRVEKILARTDIETEFQKAHDKAFGHGAWDTDKAALVSSRLEEVLPKRTTSMTPGRL
jgi:hypothetical protein